MYIVGWFGCFMVFNSTFNNISAKLWQSVLLVEKTRVPEENQRGSNSKTLMVIGIDGTGSGKSNYHMITTMMTPMCIVEHV